MKKVIVALGIFLMCVSLRAQINQLDSAGNKHGKWKLYLDGFGNKLDDSTRAVFWRYTYFDHGVHIYPMGGLYNKKQTFVASNPDTPVAGRPGMLHGEYKIYSKSGQLKFIHVFDKGNYVSYKEFYSGGGLQTFFDYEKHCKDQEWSWYMYTYDKKGNVTYTECISKDEKGVWPKMRG